jgi:hypothetical protein
MPTLVLGVPGTWASRAPLIQGCAERGYLWAGMRSVVLDPRTQRPHPFSIEVYEPDPRLREAFESVCVDPLPEETLAAIERHTMTLYRCSRWNPPSSPPTLP